MGYTQALLTRWSRRDYLTIVVIAVTTAFLVGTIVLLSAAATQTAMIAHGMSSSSSVTYKGSYTTAKANAGGNDIVLPLAETTQSNGNRITVVGIPKDAPETIKGASVKWDAAKLPKPPQNHSIYGPTETQETVRLKGKSGTQAFTVTPHPEKSILSPSWYISDESTVKSIGTTGALVVHQPSTTHGKSANSLGIPLVNAYNFLLSGINQVIQLFSLATLAGAVVVLVVIYNVTRMSVRDRIETIKIIRATGGNRIRVLALYGLRSSLLTLVGIALGYALGIIVIRATVNIAIDLGLPIAIHPGVTHQVLSTLLPSFFVLWLVGSLAGVLAARPATRRSPAALSVQTSRKTSKSTSNKSRLHAVLTPTLLDWRVIIPTTATLSIFAVIVLLVAALSGIIAPLNHSSNGAILEAGASSPLGSSVNPQYAQALRSHGVKASPEIILAETHKGQPYIARGANFTAFSAVSDAHLTSGHIPRTSSEAVIGHDLAKTLGLKVGDTVTLGGSISPAVARVKIVGVYRGSGMSDDQLIVPLPTAQHLSTKSQTVQLIRTKGLSKNRLHTNQTGISVTDIHTITPAVTGVPMNISVTVQNFDDHKKSQSVTVSVGNTTASKQVTLKSNGRRQLTFHPRVKQAGHYTIQAGSQTQSVTVQARDAPQILVLPKEAPPGSTLLIPVTTATNEPISGATVTFGNEKATTNKRGVAIIHVPTKTGSYHVTAKKGNQTTDKRTVQVQKGVQRQVAAQVKVRPKRANVYTTPTMNVTVGNIYGTKDYA